MSYFQDIATSVTIVPARVTAVDDDTATIAGYVSADGGTGRTPSRVGPAMLLTPNGAVPELTIPAFCHEGHRLVVGAEIVVINGLVQCGQCSTTYTLGEFGSVEVLGTVGPGTVTVKDDNAGGNQ